MNTRFLQYVRSKLILFILFVDLASILFYTQLYPHIVSHLLKKNVQKEEKAWLNKTGYGLTNNIEVFDKQLSDISNSKLFTSFAC